MLDGIGRGAWSTALPDWEDRIRNQLSLIPDLPLFDAQAEKALRIFKRLRIPDLIGKPTYGEVSAEWVFDLVRAIFGAYDPDLKKRMIREFFVLVPKKNGKSSIAAAIIVTAAIMNERPMAELLLIAPTEKVASISFSQAKGIIQADPDLESLFHIQGHINQITHRVSKAVIVIKAASTDVVTGSKATYILIDETHVLASKNKAADLLVEIRGSLASRPDGFLLQITTQSKAPPTGQFKKELDRARMVRDGTMDISLLAILYELPRDIAPKWRDPSTWPMVNPNIEMSVSSEFLREQLLKAEEDGPDALALFASQHLNVEMGSGEIQDRWTGAAFWQGDPEVNLETIKAQCEVCVVGIDGGGMDDLLGLTVVGRHRETREWLSWSRAWVHEIGLERRKSIAPKLRELADEGDLVICSEPGQDVREVAAICIGLNRANLLPKKAAVGLDPEGVTAILDALEEGGMTVDQLVPVSQGYKLTGAIKGTERKLFEGSLRPAQQAMMVWCVSNAKTELRGNAVIVTKAQSGTGKIDPLMALFNAVTLMSWHPEAQLAGMARHFERLAAE